MRLQLHCIRPNDVNPDVAVAYNQYNTYCDIEFKFLEVEIPNDQIGKYPARSDWANRLNAYGMNFLWTQFSPIFK